MIDTLVSFIHGELIAYIGMILILTAFFLETRDCQGQNILGLLYNT